MYAFALFVSAVHYDRDNEQYENVNLWTFLDKL